jgi:hypothetical protein
MKPVYAVTSNTEISYGETFSFLRDKICNIAKGGRRRGRKQDKTL